MNNFKSGSGNLDFGGDDDEETESTVESPKTPNTGSEGADSSASEEPASDPADEQAETAGTASQSGSERVSTTESSPPDSGAEKYPYFVRRSNVGDERDTRLELHVRDKVADQEAQFRNALAERLDTTEISKTDAREFALLAAFNDPERVAELMRDEGFGTLG